jgi:hypothetical protein
MEEEGLEDKAPPIFNPPVCSPTVTPPPNLNGEELDAAPKFSCKEDAVAVVVEVVGAPNLIPARGFCEEAVEVAVTPNFIPARGFFSGNWAMLSWPLPLLLAGVEPDIEERPITPLPLLPPCFGSGADLSLLPCTREEREAVILIPPPPAALS